MSEDYPLRKPCERCGSETGFIISRGFQDCVYCSECQAWQYNAPRRETGKPKLSVSSSRDNIKPKQRARILLRANRHCEICGADPPLDVGHLLSVKDGKELGIISEMYDSDENLAAMCPECNSGISGETVPLRLVLAILMARLKNHVEAELDGTKYSNGS